MLKKQYGYIESHHIVPKSFKLGGDKDISNIVYFTAREHFIAHCLLVKSFNGKYRQKMIFALQRMKQTNKFQECRYFNSKIFESFRKQKSKFIRLYLLDKVKYINIEDDIQNFINVGWSKIMTSEYKIGRVGMMKGRKHSDETKLKQSKNNPKIWQGKNLSEEHKANISAGYKNNPHIYTDEQRKRRSEINKQLHANGIINFKGDNNPNSLKRRKERSLQTSFLSV